MSNLSLLKRGALFCSVGLGFAIVVHASSMKEQDLARLRDRARAIVGQAETYLSRMGTTLRQFGSGQFGPGQTGSGQIGAGEAGRGGTGGSPSAPPAERPGKRTAFAKLDAVPVAPSCDLEDNRAAGTVAGDKIQIRFFEKSSFTMGTNTREIAFERLDLSGTYEVTEPGDIALPLLGRIPVRALDLGCVEGAIAERFFEALRSEATVSASFVTRPPVLVSGAVRSPGSYAFTTGMTVGHLLTLAGAPADGGVQNAQQATLLLARRNELERLSFGIEIERRRIEAALRDKRDLGLSGPLLAKALHLLGPDRLDAENAALAAEADAFETQKTARASEAASYAARIAAAQQHLSTVEVQIRQQAERLAELEKLQARGYGAPGRVESGAINAMALERALIQAKNEVLQLRTAQEAAQRNSMIATADRRERLARQVRETLRERDALAAQIAAIDTQIEALDSEKARQKGLELALVVQRRTEEGPIDIAADAGTRLLPGDVVTVGIDLDRIRSPAPTALGKSKTRISEGAIQ